MKKIKLLGLIFLSLFIQAFATAQSNQNFVVKGYSMTILGGSNLHDWKETVGRVTGKGTLNWNGNSFDVSGLNIWVLVSSIKGTEGSIMDNKTYSALKSDKNPLIVFTQTSPLNAFPADGASHPFSVTGNLSIAGVTKTATLQGQGKSAGKNQMTFTGSHPMKMSDFGIKPPKALLGMLKVTDNVTIQYSVTLDVTP